MRINLRRHQPERLDPQMRELVQRTAEALGISEASTLRIALRIARETNADLARACRLLKSDGFGIWVRATSGRGKVAL